MFENIDGTPLPYTGITNFTPSIPKFYWDVDSQEQGIKQLWKIIAKLMDYSNEIGTQTNINTADVATLKELFTKFIKSGFEDYYADLLRAWLDNNVQVVYDRLAKQVYFGLTDDGYFCAYVPDGWSDITFDTGAVYGTPEYGRLILGFDATGSGIIPARSDYRTLDRTVQSALAAAAGSGISYSERKLSVNSGNGLSINSATNMVEVPLGENLRYTSSGIDVPEADNITRGVVKLTHDVNNLDGEEKAVTSAGVFAYAPNKKTAGVSPLIKLSPSFMQGVYGTAFFANSTLYLYASIYVTNNEGDVLATINLGQVNGTFNNVSATKIEQVPTSLIFTVNDNIFTVKFEKKRVSSSAYSIAIAIPLSFTAD